LFEDRALLAALASDDNLKSMTTLFEAEEESRRYSGWRWGSAPLIAAEYARQLSSQNAIGREQIANAKKVLGMGVKVPTLDDVLKTKAVPFSNRLMFWYLTIFVAAETSFILMALKEYLQDLAHISDLSLMGLDAAELVAVDVAKTTPPPAEEQE
jgi:hypothetical protein